MSPFTDLRAWNYGVSWTGQLIQENGTLRILIGPEISAIEAMLREIERALDAELYYLAIIICLMLPDVCAALEATDGRTSERRYKEWYAKHAKEQAGGAEPDECYSLRCGMTHQGKMEIKKGLADGVIFTLKGSSYRLDGFTLETPMGRAYAFDAENWCRRWIAAVRIWFEAAKSDPVVQRNMESILQVRPLGLAPYFVGQPIIA
jgi:hypothetical protein